MTQGGWLQTTKQITQDVIDFYARISGDRNPIHIDPEWSSSSGFGRTIAHGQLIVGYLSALLENEYGSEWVSGGSLDVKFVAPAYSGEAVILDVTQSESGYDIEVTDSARRTLVVGTAAINRGV